MAKYLEFDKKHYGRDGNIPLTRGDDWSLDGYITEEKGSYSTRLILSGYSATAFFKNDPALSETPIPASVELKECGDLTITIPASSTPNVKIADQGVEIYLELLNGESKKETIYTYNQPIAVREQGFTQF